jgi:hypothetical protein
MYHDTKTRPPVIAESDTPIRELGMFTMCSFIRRVLAARDCVSLRLARANEHYISLSLSSRVIDCTQPSTGVLERYDPSLIDEVNRGSKTDTLVGHLSYVILDKQTYIVCRIHLEPSFGRIQFYSPINPPIHSRTPPYPAEPGTPPSR